MLTMAFECSAVAASVAVFDDAKLLGQSYGNVKLTHSQTLMPMAENLLSSLRLTFGDVERYAISHGPGSFTGVRIGIAAVKGLAAAKDTDCVGVSTLEAMAHQVPIDGIICCLMDARCGQVYNALFERKGDTLTRLCEDRAVLMEEVLADLPADKNIILVGDGAELFKNKLNPENAALAPAHLIYQSAVGVGLAAMDKAGIKADALLPFYLRLPQAERELKKRKEEIK